jgi:hypothetical protein
MEIQNETMIKKIKVYNMSTYNNFKIKHHCLAACLMLLGLNGCGGGTNGDADDTAFPPGTEIRISPASQSFTISEFRDANGDCRFGEVFQDIPVLISVLDTGGTGNVVISDVDLTISLNFSGNTFPNGPSVLQLYEDQNGNGVVDHPQELVSDVNDPLFTTKTAKFSGEKLMFVRMDLACPYRGSLFVIAGGVLGIMELVTNTDSSASTGNGGS